jgi:MYXO-CTERM domain-containing protein
MRPAEEIGPGTDCATEPAGRRPTMTRWLTFLLALAGGAAVQSLLGAAAARLHRRQPARSPGHLRVSPGADAHYTEADLDALHDDYIALLRKYGHSAEDAPPGARHVQSRMSCLPDEPAQPEEQGKPAESGS